jgi:hypothetical protein
VALAGMHLLVAVVIEYDPLDACRRGHPGDLLEGVKYTQLAIPLD